eukprot:242431_1
MNIIITVILWYFLIMMIKSQMRSEHCRQLEEREKLLLERIAAENKRRKQRERELQKEREKAGALDIGTMMAAISEDDAGMTQGTEKCPSEDQVREILSNNGFKNASEIAKDYQMYIEDEAYEQETLMEDLRDPDGSWIADSELKTIFNWNNQQTTKFKQLVLKLIVQKQKAIQMR